MPKGLIKQKQNWTLCAQNKATEEPCANCFNPDASGPVCTGCRYPRFILDPAARYPGIGCSRCLSLDFEHLGNGQCNGCRCAWPGFVAEGMVSEAV
jgi:hypothetical protein